MEKANVPFGAWRIDPQKRSQVIDQFGRKVASVEPEVDASLIATAPDMFGLLEKLDSQGESIPQDLRSQLQLVLRRARGDFGLAAFTGFGSRHRLENEDWLKFIDGLWEPRSVSDGEVDKTEVSRWNRPFDSTRVERREFESPEGCSSDSHLLG